MSEEGSPPPTPTMPPSHAAPPPVPAWVDAMWAPAPAAPPLPPSPQAPGAPPRPSRRLLLWALVALAAMGCMAAAGVSYWWTQRGPDHPDTWDPRVVELVEFVEQERGVAFEHPVTVNFLDPEQYAEITAAPEGGHDDEAIVAAEDQVAMFRALGLMTGEVDLLGSSQDLFGSSTAAFYDSISEQVYVNATADDGLSTSTAATVVHELTHVLQDQVDGLDEAFADDADPTTDRTDAHLAIVEGDAMVVEGAYLSSLSGEELDSYRDEWRSLVEESDEAVDAAEVPAALDLLFEVPYALGPSFVTVAHAVGDRAVVDAAIGGDVPPSVAVLDLRTGDRPDEGPPEVPSHGGEELDVDTFGAMTWLVVLGGASTPEQALAASSSWAADRVVRYRDDQDRLCLAATVVVDDPDDDAESSADPVDETATFAAAAARWAASLPLEAGATAVRDGDEVQLRSCDPGPEVEVTAAASEGAADAVEYASLLNGIVAEVASMAGAEVDVARCYGLGLVEHFGVDRLVDEQDLVGSAEFADVAATVGVACAVPGG